MQQAVAQLESVIAAVTLQQLNTLFAQTTIANFATLGTRVCPTACWTNYSYEGLQLSKPKCVN